MSQTLPKFSRYRVRRGDSLWKISVHAYGRGDLWQGISEANHLKRGRPILAGMDLVIPTARQSIHKTLHGTVTAPQPSAPQHPTALEHPAPTTPPIPAQHAPSNTLPASTKSGPFQPARPVLFPQFKYEVNRVVADETIGNINYKLSFVGELTVQKEGVITGGLTFTKEGIEGEYKKEADGALTGLFSKPGWKIAGDGKSAEISMTIGSTFKSGDQVLASSETSVIPPSTIKYTNKGRECKIVRGGFEFAGVLGYEFLVTARVSPKEPEPHPVHVTHWVKVAGVGLVVLAGVIVVADIAKDIGTLGAGTVESPLSFAAAAEALGQGMALLRAAAPVAGAAAPMLRYAH
ncbi:LysM peptidoglycan-binding domain-containing protein [Granulicella arctica]|uniref:LysM peptidoglycan-binding domain-containing protein n=1 Tax=Granulicella arctica TaxID=940613 RepID=UPI0021E01600|nr:LysM peptidoglycan-binding domain-containing protein [Granulicella arctica]